MEGKPLVLMQIGVTAVVMMIGLVVLYGGFSPPDAPARPRVVESIGHTQEEVKLLPQIYRALVEQDGRRWSVQVPSAAALAEPIPYFDEIVGKRKLSPGKPIETRHLAITYKIAKVQATVDGQSFRYDHMVLSIKNNTNKYLAYRVITQVPSTVKCTNKGDIPHNAIVLSPGMTVERTECMFKDGITLHLLSAEVMEVLPLSAYYISRLPPSLVLYDARTAAGHIPLAQPLCRQTVNWQDIQRGVETNQFSWKDLMDFYARHSCDEYSFFDTYRYRQDPNLPLPAKPSGP